MTVPNRSYSSPSYRYGFQGQEKDDEIKGNGNSINYKFRMHDPRIGRFFAVDPLAGKYPWNSPYAFSENRVINGFELEGLEYATYTITTLNGHFQNIRLETDYELKNKATKGAGIQYNYIHNYTGDYKIKNSNISASEFLRERGNSSYHNRIVRTEKKEIFDKNYHGLYVGPDNPELPELITSQGKYTNYGLAPVDILDAAAKQHDKDYDKVNAKGIHGAVIDVNTVPADIDLVKRANGVIEMYKNKEIDPYTKKAVSKSTYSMALKVKNSFTALVMNKLFNSNVDQDRIIEQVDSLQEVKKD